MATPLSSSACASGRPGPPAYRRRRSQRFARKPQAATTITCYRRQCDGSAASERAQKIALAAALRDPWTSPFGSPPGALLSEQAWYSVEGSPAGEVPIRVSGRPQPSEGYDFGPDFSSGIGSLGAGGQAPGLCHGMFVDLPTARLGLGHAIVDAAIKARTQQARQEPKCDTHDSDEHCDFRR